LHLFAYGTLMCPKIMLRVAGFLPGSFPARLDHYRRGPLSGVDYPAITPHRDSSVAGLLYLDLTPEAWLRLDEFEDKIYYRCRVNVSIAAGRTMTANSYVIKQKHLDRLGESEWNYFEFLSSGKERFEKDYEGFPNQNNT
jgi:gamma-glutamylcyclotransferase (GGCT)/AIG2-like uncharacterized protein YtfP